MPKEYMEIGDKDMEAIQSLGAGNSPFISYEQIVALRSGQYARAKAYERYRDQLDSVVNSDDPRDVAAVAKINADLSRLNNLRHRDVMPGTVHTNAALTNLSVMYANEAFIGEQLMPIVPVNKLTDLYYTYDQRDRFQYPPDELGPRGDANEITEGRSSTTYACVGYGYENYLDADTLFDQDAPLNEMADLTEAIAEGLAFRRELRIAAIMVNGTNYGANTSAIAAADRWDTADGGDPIKNFQDAKAALWMGRGPTELVMFSSLDVYNVLSRHPQILDLYKYSGGTVGLATPDMIARFFGASRYLVGEARKETANEAVTASYSRVWSDVFGMVRVMRRPSKRSAAFGVTFRHRNIESKQWFDQRKGVHGGYFAKTAVSETHDIIAPLTGYLYTTPIG